MRHRVSTTWLQLPHFDHQVPLLTGPDGYHYVPLFALCQMLGLNATNEIQRARYMLLWDLARLLPLEINGRICGAWSLPYPLHVGYWFGMAYERVADPARREQLKRAIDDSMELSEQAYQAVEAQFEDGRRRMYRLALQVKQLRSRLETLLDTPTINVHDEALAGIIVRATALADLVEPFVRGWLSDAAGLPVIDSIRVDDTGAVIDSHVPSTLFGTLQRADAEKLDAYEVLLARTLTQLAEWAYD